MMMTTDDRMVLLYVLVLVGHPSMYPSVQRGLLGVKVLRDSFEQNWIFNKTDFFSVFRPACDSENCDLPTTIEIYLIHLCRSLSQQHVRSKNREAYSRTHLFCTGECEIQCWRKHGSYIFSNLDYSITSITRTNSFFPSLPSSSSYGTTSKLGFNPGELSFDSTIVPLYGVGCQSQSLICCNCGYFSYQERCTFGKQETLEHALLVLDILGISYIYVFLYLSVAIRNCNVDHTANKTQDADLLVPLAS